MRSLFEGGLIRCMFRRESAVGFLLIAGMANALVLAITVVGEGPAWLHPGRGGGVHYTDLAILCMALFIGCAGLGVLVSASLTELLACQFTWFAKGMQTRIRRDLGILFGLSLLALAPIALGLGTTDFLGQQLGAHLPIGLLGLAPFGMAIGLVLFCPNHGTVLRSAAGLGLIGTAMGMEQVLRSAVESPLLCIVTGALPLPFILAQKLGRRIRIAKLLAGRAALANTHRHPFEPKPWERALRKGKLASPKPEAAALRTKRDLMKQLVAERWDWSRGTWPLGRLGPGGVCVLGLGFITLLWSQQFLSQGAAPVDIFFAITWNPDSVDGLMAGDSPFLRLAMPTMVYLVLLAVSDRMQPALRTGHVYPMSRSDRAEFYWLQALRNWGPTTLRIGLALFAVSTYAGLISSVPWSAKPPFWLISLACAVAVLPVTQISASLRDLLPGKTLSSIQALGAMITLSTVSYVLTVTTAFFISDQSSWNAWLWVALSPVFCALGQVLLRSLFHRRLSTMDLA